MINKKNIPLILALAIPLIMIVLVAAFIYLPGIGQKPKYNFVYMTGTPGYYAPYGSGGLSEYVIVEGHVKKNQLPQTLNSPKYPVPTDTHFFVYDIETNKAKELTFEQTQIYNLNPHTVSDDGYSLERGSGGGDFIFGASGDYNSWFIKGHNRSKKLNLVTIGYGYDNVQFLGWIQ